MRISTRFTLLSTSAITLAAVVALAAILFSDFNNQKRLLTAEIESAVARSDGLPAAIHLEDRETQVADLGLLILGNPLAAGALIRDLDDDITATAGLAKADLPSVRPRDTDPVAIFTATVESSIRVSTRTISGLDIPQVYVVSAPILTAVNPLESVADNSDYQRLAAANAGGARFVSGYVEVYVPVGTLIWSLLPQANTLLLGALIMIVIAFLFVRGTVRRISRPMEQLAATADEISSGRMPKTLQLSRHRKDEISDIANVLNGVIEGVHKMTAKLNVDRELMSIKVDTAKKQLSEAEAQVDQTRNRLKRVAYYDHVTSLPNRRLMVEQLEILLRIAAREKRHLGVLVVDVENLRRINDSLGREGGDTVLRTIGKRLASSLRKSDVISSENEEAVKTSDVSRIGNNEFCALLHGVAQYSDVLLTANRLHTELSAPIDIEGTSVVPTIRMGVAVSPDHGLDSEDLLRAADIAVTEARHRNSNEPLLFSRELDDAGSERFQLETDLRRANFDREMTLFYQAQIDCSTGQVCGAEALVRWNHPKQGNIPPFKFIPIAEETGIIIDLGQWIIEQACRDMAAFRNRGLPIPKLSVNISALQLTDDLIDIVSYALAANQLPPEALQLELTESLLVQDVDAVLAKLHRLRDKVGVRLSVDDFGTGYSSLAYLARFPLNELKVDRSFVVGMEADEAAARVTGAIIAMAQQLDLEVVVEGVDNPLQLQRLHGFGANVIQGFLFARPIPVEEFTAFVRAGEWREVLSAAELPPRRSAL